MTPAQIHTGKHILEWLTWIVSVLFHPVFIPFYTVWLYFSVSSFYFFDHLKLLRLIFLSAILVPLLLQMILYNLKILRSFFLNDLRARIYFTLLMAMVYFFLWRAMHHNPGLQEPPRYFLGISIGLVLTAAVNLMTRRKPSLHLLATGGTLVFLMHWSVVHRENILPWIAAWVLLTGVLAFSRYFLRAHSLGELLAGWLLGITGMAVVWMF